MDANKIKLMVMFGISSFLPSFLARSMDLALPTIGDEFGMTIIALSWIITVYLLTTSVLVIPFGRLADIIGRKKIFVAGISLFTVASILCSLAYSGKFLIAARLLQGISCAMLFSTATALIVSIFPLHERGKAIGMSVACVYLGSSLGPSLGGIMTQYFGWRSTFILAAGFGLIAIIMAISYLVHEKTESHGESFDFIGSILYATAAVSLLYGTTMLPKLTGYAVIGIGVILFAVFCVAEDYVKHPVFDIDLLLKNKTFAMSSLAAFLNFSAAFSVTFLMSLFLQYIKGMDPKTAGFIILASPITMVIGSPITGKLSDRVDPRIVASIGMALSSLALFAMSFCINSTTPIAVMVGLLLLFGAGLSLFATPNTSAAMGAVESRHLGVAASVINSMRLFGQTISMGISMLVLSLFVGKVEISDKVLPQLATSISVAFFIFGILCFIGIFASLARGRRLIHHEQLENING